MDLKVSYISCKDAAPVESRRRYTFEEAIFAGWAEDGGMLLPDHIPQISIQKLHEWAAERLSYPEVCFRIMRLFIPEHEIQTAELHQIIVDDAFRGFGIRSVVSLKTDVFPSCGANIAVCELWHGPTLAFKDLGMTILTHLLQHFLEKRDRFLALLVGTSGDTGSSAIEAVKDLPRVSITCLYPKGRGITLLQELQMTTVGEVAPRVKVIAVEGNSDDLDRPIEEVFADTEFKQRYRVGSVNSVNICRPLVQVVHFFWSYLQLLSASPERPPSVVFYVPTGAGGHITAGVIAKQMGLPVDLHVATNTNDVFHHILAHGRTLDVAPGVCSTVSPSMDIMIPYNLERLFYIAAGGAADNSGNVARQVAVKYFELGLFHSHDCVSLFLESDDQIQTRLCFKTSL
jgi:threonine synthase